MRSIINVFKRLLLFLVFKWKYHNKLQFYYSSIVEFNESDFEGANRIHPHSYFRGSMGYGSYIGPYCRIVANIGRFTSIAPYVRSNTGVHPITFPYATTCPMFFSTLKQNGKTFANRKMFEEFKKPSSVGNDVWIGEGVFFSGGVTIGDGAVVLAGSVVTKDVPPYAVVGGVPAKIIKYRYDEDTIRFLLKLKWWNYDVKWLSEHWELFNDVEELKMTIRGKEK